MTQLREGPPPPRRDRPRSHTGKKHGTPETSPKPKSKTKTVIGAMFNTVKQKRIAVLGFAFKKDTGDTRETPAIDVCRGLLADGA